MIAQICCANINFIILISYSFDSVLLFVHERQHRATKKLMHFNEVLITTGFMLTFVIIN